MGPSETSHEARTGFWGHRVNVERRYIRNTSPDIGMSLNDALVTGLHGSLVFCICIRVIRPAAATNMMQDPHRLDDVHVG